MSECALVGKVDTQFRLKNVLVHVEERHCREFIGYWWLFQMQQILCYSARLDEQRKKERKKEGKKERKKERKKEGKKDEHVILNFSCIRFAGHLKAVPGHSYY